MTWPVFVINMAANTTRMGHAAEELGRMGIPFIRFDAVDGRALSPDELAHAYDPIANLRRARHPMVGPEIGCYMSHIALWERIAASDAAGGIILEDDFSSADDLAAVLAAVSKDDDDWDIVKLFSARVGQKILDCRPHVTGRQIAVPYKVPNITLGYAIRRDTAARILARAFPVSRPVDEDHKHFWELGLRVAMVVPSPLAFGVQNAETGTITAARTFKRSRHFGTAWLQLWRSLSFNINYVLNLHWQRFYFWK